MRAPSVVAAVALTLALLSGCKTESRTSQCHRFVAAIGEAGKISREGWPDHYDPNWFAFAIVGLQQAGKHVDAVSLSDKTLKGYQSRYVAVLDRMVLAIGATQQAFDEGDTKAMTEATQRAVGIKGEMSALEGEVLGYCPEEKLAP